MDNAQKLALRTHILANTTQLAFGAGTAQINTVFAASPLNSGDAALIAEWYNLTAVPDYWIIKTDAQVADIRNAILFARYTPAPGVTGANAAQHSACSNACMAKQGVLVLLGIQAGGTFDATKATQVASLKDATTVLPSAAAFANQDAGWSGSATCVANTLVRKARNLEKVFALNQSVPSINDGVSARGVWNTATGLGNPDTTSLYGATVSGDEISDIKGLPA